MSDKNRPEDLQPGYTTIGWIGTGVMGLPMCRHILRTGYTVNVFNRSREKAASLLEQGANWLESPQAVASRSDLVFTMVGFPEDVREVYLGSRGILAGARPDTILVDMTTTEPLLARTICEEASKHGVHTLDAPVSGGDVGARNATLTIMVGGELQILDTVLPILRILGTNIAYQGPAGAGQHAKMCNQIVIAGTMIGVCESLLYGYKAGLDLPTMLSAIQTGAARCWALENLAPRLLHRDFAPGFFVDHFIKDMGIALKEAARMRLALPGLALVHQMYLAVQAQSHGKDGTQALLLALEKMAGIEVAAVRPEGHPGVCG
jgi:3-hydroxyisobutyrate dehydrogenase